MKIYIKNKIINFLREQKYSQDLFDKIEVLSSRNRLFGDYTSNIALKISAKENKSAIEIAEKIRIFLLKDKDDFENLTVTKPGFINFYLSNRLLSKTLIAFGDQNYLPSLEFKKKKVNYEFVSANPTGNLHIGHARNAIVGDAFLRVLEYLENEITREYYINDAGAQIKNLADSVFYYYSKFAKLKNKLDVSNVTYHGQEIIYYAQQLSKQKRLFTQEQLMNISKKYFLVEIEKTLESLKIRPFTVFTSEQWLIDSKRVDKMFIDLKKTKYVYEKDGALWIASETFGDDKNRVLIKSDGTFTYMVPDVANHIYKFERGFDWMINLWGSDHHGYEKRIKAGLEILGYDSKKLDVDYISMVKIVENDQEIKMSKRKGTSLTINDVLEIIDPNILKFYILAKSREQQIKIDVGEIKEKSINNPYWYVQYVNARLERLFLKYQLKNDKTLLVKNFVEIFKLKIKQEEELIYKLIEYDDIIASTYLVRDASLILNYLKDLAGKFHSYYGEVLIIDPENPELTYERISLLIVFKNLYHKLFDLLGIEVIKEM